MSEARSASAKSSDDLHERKGATHCTPLPLLTARLPGEDRLYSMIAEAAYYLAEQRGFSPGHDIEDWLAAEASITGRSRQPSEPPSDLAH